MENNNSEMDIIQQLLKVEKESAFLIDEALQTAEKKLAKAHADFNAEYKNKYDQGVKSLESDFEKLSEEKQNQRQKELESFKSELKNKKQSSESFNKFLDFVFAQNN